MSEASALSRMCQRHQATHLVCVCLQTVPSKMLISPTELERKAIYIFHLNIAQVGNHRTYTTEEQETDMRRRSKQGYWLLDTNPRQGTESKKGEHWEWR